MHRLPIRQKCQIANLERYFPPKPFRYDRIPGRLWLVRFADIAGDAGPGRAVFLLEDPLFAHFALRTTAATAGRARATPPALCRIPLRGTGQAAKGFIPLGGAPEFLEGGVPIGDA